MQPMYGYIRVSTVRQGTRGVSLQEQRAAIEQYAGRNGLRIDEWFEERETAAKLGRPVFSRMLKMLRRGKAAGVVIHKIDRSARNLRDWAALGDLLDAGIDVRFAHDSVDMHARGGRLSADIQAVIAADFVRNLREETKKGFYGRLKQGFYPMRAPLGYLDRGAGKAKVPDPARAPLVREAFRLYATGEYPLDRLAGHLAEMGLRNRDGGILSRNGLAAILHNPFYMGLMRIQRSGETFAGNHEPLVARSLFETVQGVLSGKAKKGAGRHDFLFRRIVTCKTCNRSYVGETQKGSNYYRCHACKDSCLREETLKERLREAFSPLLFRPDELEEVSRMAGEMQGARTDARERARKDALLRRERCESRLDRLTDAYVDGVIEKDAYLRRKESVLKEMKGIEEECQEGDDREDRIGKRLTERIELLKSLYLGYARASTDQKRDLIRKLCSNLQVAGKKVIVELNSPFRELAEFMKGNQGTPCRAASRRPVPLPERQPGATSGLGNEGLSDVFRILAEDGTSGK